MNSFNLNDHKTAIILAEKSYSTAQREIILKLQAAAEELDYKLYLVGGAVRDALMGERACDIDMAVLGDALVLANAFSKQASISAHHNFGTATLVWDKETVDLATLRKESYLAPAALPIVSKTTDILEDLKRRDFTINAMAYTLTSNSGLIDPYAGRNDIKNRVIRVLHEKSFQDDPTRAYRAARYAARFGFEIEVKTLALLQRDISFIKLLSNDRLYNELMTALSEEEPEKTLLLWQEIGLLEHIFPHLDAKKAATSFQNARKNYGVSVNMYLATLLWDLNNAQMRQFLNSMNPTRTTMRLLEQTTKLKSVLPSIAQRETNYEIYQFLQDFSDEALNVALSQDSVGDMAKKNIIYFKEKLRQVKLDINGHTLIDMGMGSGAQMAEVLQKTLQQKLNKGFDDTAEEEEFAKKYAEKRKYLVYDTSD